MKSEINTGLKPRKQPKQSRSRQMQADILEAAIRVLKQDGLQAFTMAHVAEVTGISVGSLYQYYPNKNSILFDLQRQTMMHAWQATSAILADDSISARAKIGKISAMFFSAEAAEMKQMGAALMNLEFAEAKKQEFKALDADVLALFSAFLKENGSENAQKDAAFLIATLDAMGHYCAMQNLSDDDISSWAERTKQMICDHLNLAEE